MLSSKLFIQYETLNFILLYWREEIKVFNKNFKILKYGPDKNAVHDLRVAIKKIVLPV